MRLLLVALLCVSACGQKAVKVERTPAPTFANECWTHRTYGRTAQAIECFTKLLASKEPVRRAEALWGVGRYQAAVDEFNAAIKARPSDIWARIRLGDLFLERYQPGDAAKAFEEAMEMDESHPRALLGLARVLGERWDRRAVELAQKALEADPKLNAARELLARMAAEEGDFTKATEHADQAMAASADSWDAMAVRGAIDLLQDHAPSPWLDRVLQANPAYGEAFNIAGELMVLNRRYHEGIQLFRRAIEIRPSLFEARARLGINLMRLGQEEEARTHLTLCYENGYRSNPVVNTLRLMDSYKNFVTYKTERTILRLHKKEADILEPYFQAEMDRVIGTYSKKYGHEVKTPIQVEVYPDHEDFAVRTMGMPGLGALGVSFGPIVAMDSPTGRRPGSFHWASTLWHEMSHVYALDMTGFRVPRWFTEGLAVYEETAIAPDWGDRLDPPAIIAIRDKKLLPVEKLDRGFIRPTSPAQVTVSYFQGGRICQYIANNWGYPKLIEMLRDYGARKMTKEVFETRLGISPDEFDKRFIAWVEKETAGVVSKFKSWQEEIKLLAAAHKAKDWESVLRDGPRLRDMYPDYVEAASPYEFLYDGYTAKGDKTAARDELRRYSKAAGRDPRLLKALASLEEESGNKRGAAEALKRLIYIYPAQDEELHRRLGSLLMEENDHLGAVREFRALVASKPVDPAAANLLLAQAYRAARQPEQAKDAVLAALEAAPGYRPAQKLLLELNTAESGGGPVPKKKANLDPNN